MTTNEKTNEVPEACPCGSGLKPWWVYDWRKVSDPKTGVGTTTWVCSKCTK